MLKRLGKIMVCLALSLLAWSFRQDKELYKSWFYCFQILLKLYNFELSEAIIKKVYMMFVNVGLIGGLGFLKQFE